MGYTGKIIYLLLYIAPPIVLAILHINAISVESTRTVNKIKISGMSNELSFSQANFGEVKAVLDEQVSKGLDDIFRYTRLIDIQPNIIRHDFFLKHNIKAKIPYTDKTSNDTKTYVADYTLSCFDQNITLDVNTIVMKNLQLNDRDNNDKGSIEEIVGKCFNNMYGGFENDLGHLIFIDPTKIEVFPPYNKIIFSLKPDLMSRSVILVGWYIFWIGFMILLRDGPGKIILGLFGTKKRK
jgi:hypothetical protein